MAVTSPRTLSALRVTITMAAAATLFNAIYGLLLAWVLARYTFPGKRILDALVDVPFALPTAVAGLALTALFARNPAIDPNEVEDGEDFKTRINPNSRETLTSCQVEPSLAGAKPGSHYQFERLGYFCADSADSSDSRLVFNRAVTLRDQWAKIEKTLKR